MSKNRFVTDTSHQCTNEWRGKKHLEDLDADETTTKSVNNTGRDLIWFYDPMTRSSERSTELSCCRTSAEFLSTNEDFWYVTQCCPTDVKTFQRNQLPQSGYTMADGRRGSRFLWNIDGGSGYPWNVGTHPPEYMELQLHTTVNVGVYKYTMMNQTQQNFIMFIIVLGRHVSILIESISGPSKNTDPYLAMFKMLSKDLYS